MPPKKKTVKAAKKTSSKKKKVAKAVKKIAIKKVGLKSRRSILAPKVSSNPVKKVSILAKSKILNQELLIEESKYTPGPVIQNYTESKSFELPVSYGDNKIVLMVRDPYWVFTYWEINQNKINEIRNELGGRLNSSALILRIYDTSTWHFFDINVQGLVGNWYINVGRPNTSYCIDIGFLTADGYFIVAARSNIVTTPRDKMSDVMDEEWMIPDWEKMYALSGGFGRGKGSMEIREIIEKRQWLGVSSSPVKKSK